MSKPEDRHYSAQLGNSTITFETGQLAQQAGGSVVVKMGESMHLVTATASKDPRDLDFMPLTIEFEERIYAEGRIPGSFFRREGRPNEDAILTCRLTDRPLRPLFDKKLRHDIQVVITALSSDAEHYLDIMAVNAASAALMISDIPWAGPIGAVRIGLVDGEFLVNPTIPEMKASTLDLRIAGTKEAILMVEAGANEVPEEQMLEALRLAHESIQDVIAVQLQMQAEIGKEKRLMLPEVEDNGVRAIVEPWLEGKMRPLLEAEGTRAEKSVMQDNLRAELLAAFAENEELEPSDILKVYQDIYREATRARILDDQIRPDNRRPTEIRDIWGEVSYLPRVHGSAIFTRGETQILSIATLGMPDEEQRLDTLWPYETKRYLHHYNFPPYSTGETGRIGGTKRREIGHGALAERALIPVIPDSVNFPYTIRVVSEAISSNGSTSMGSVCGSTMSLMDAGVPLKAPVSGIAMGLVTEPESNRFVILSDIQGLEDALGDMDFKVAGTREGITALQMDIKIQGLPWDALQQALAQAKDGRLHILAKMEETISAPREDVSQHAPRITTVQIDPEKIGKIIGPGGKMVRAIQEETGVQISIEEDGTVYIGSTNADNAAAAKERIQLITADPVLGEIYTGTVVRAVDFGLFVEILPGTEGMVHISQLADYRVAAATDIADVGDEIMVMVTDISSEGKVRLSRLAVLEGWSIEEARAQDRGGNRGGGGGRRGGGDRRGGGGRRGGDRRGGSSNGSRDRRRSRD